MATEFVLPSLGESVESGTVVKLLVEVGETIEEDQAILELETDKAVTEVPSTVTGIIGEILVKAGDKIKVGQAILTLSGDAAKTEEKAEAKPAEAKPAEAKPTEAAQSGNVGASPSGEQSGLGAATDLPKEGASTGQNGHPQNGNGSTGAATSTAAAGTAASGGAAKNGASIAAAPSVRRLARELGVELGQVQGSGPHGRIVYSDVKNFLQRSAAPAAVAVGGGIAVPPLPDFAKWGEIDRQQISGIGLATARHMARCWAEVPHVTQFDKCDITDLEKLRKKYGPKAEKAGGKLTVTAITLKVVAAALKAFPVFNASLDLANEQIIYKKYINIGVAVDTPRGLVVPVIRDVDKKSIIELSAELTEIGEKARARKTTMEDMQGGGFTITNLGGIGGTSFTPIVNAPEVAILGMSRGTMEPVWNGSAFEPRLMMPLSLSYDHRAINGADGARFTRWICSALEEPFLLALEG